MSSSWTLSPRKRASILDVRTERSIEDSHAVGVVQANVVSPLDMFAETLGAIKEQTGIDSAP